jgi:hypothetical protein
MVATSLLILPLSAQYYPLSGRTITPSTIIRSLFLLAIGYLVASAFALVGTRFYGLSNVQIYAHERAYLIPLLFLPFYLQRKWVVSSVFAALAVALFFWDPRTTMAVILATSMILVWVLPRLTSKAGFLALGVGILAAIFAAVYCIANVGDLDGYFKSVIGGTSNAKMREHYFELAVDDLRTSPLLGDWFSGEVAYSYVFGSSTGASEELQRPIHNDFLMLLARGGAIGGGIFVLFMITSLVTALRNYRVCVMHGFQEMAKLLLLLAVTLVSGLICMTVNPVINSVSTGWSFYYILALVILTNRYVHRIKDSALRSVQSSCRV